MKKFLYALTILCLMGTIKSAHAAHDPCAWDNPGHDPYRSQADLTKALNTLSFDPADKALIRSSMDAHAFTDVLVITKDSVYSERTGQAYFGLRDMHSGHSTCHGDVRRDAWPAGHIERAIAYCANGDTCVVVPQVCDNVSLISRFMVAKDPDVPVVDNSELLFEPPAAGPPVVADLPPEIVAPSMPSDPVPDSGVPPSTAYYSPPFDGGGGGGGPIFGRPPKPPASAPSSPCGSSCGPVGPPGPPVTVVPEPPTIFMIAAALALIVLRVRRRFKR